MAPRWCPYLPFALFGRDLRVILESLDFSSAANLMWTEKMPLARNFMSPLELTFLPALQINVRRCVLQETTR